MLSKKFFKAKKTCKVTFQLPEGIEAKEVGLAGEFNNWQPSVNPLKKMKGVWKTTLELPQGREYQFRYFVNGSEWHNDEAADKYVPNNVDGDNSVVVT
ncbi:MAG: isoamylase early set domain-containing protein [Anaerolineae bacterium]|nr:isoamylase early set domain-containing protein [Anaerolineae bacterium]